MAVIGDAIGRRSPLAEAGLADIGLLGIGGLSSVGTMKGDTGSIDVGGREGVDGDIGDIIGVCARGVGDR